MKKIFQILCLCLVSYFAKAKDQSQNQIFVGNAVVDYNSTSNNLQLQMQVGNPILSTLNTASINARFGFPYGILYISPTFIIDGFEVSKGYYSDKVNIKLELAFIVKKIKTSSTIITLI